MCALTEIGGTVGRNDFYSFLCIEYCWSCEMNSTWMCDDRMVIVAANASAYFVEKQADIHDWAGIGWCTRVFACQRTNKRSVEIDEWIASCVSLTFALGAWLTGDRTRVLMRPNGFVSVAMRCIQNQRTQKLLIFFAGFEWRVMSVGCWHWNVSMCHEMISFVMAVHMCWKCTLRQ